MVFFIELPNYHLSFEIDIINKVGILTINKKHLEMQKYVWYTCSKTSEEVASKGRLREESRRKW